jgi:hypothetical protein
MMTARDILAAQWDDYDRLDPPLRAAIDDRRLLPVPETRRLLNLAILQRWFGCDCHPQRSAVAS